MKKLTKKQSGFTLVEIAIVLVIIGLLLGGVLKGQEMIENSRIKSIVGDLKGVSAAFNAYQDRYRAIPGDETNATMTARGWNVTANGNPNGALAITLLQTFQNGGEQVGFWQALRAANLATGASDAVGVAALPRSGTGGLIGVTVAPYGLTGISVCTAGLTTKQAAGVDTAIDGTLPATNVGNNTGETRGLNGAANPLAPTAGAPAATVYNETTAGTWTLCRPL